MTYYEKKKNDPIFQNKLKENHIKYMKKLRERAKQGFEKEVNKMQKMREYNTDYQYYRRAIINGKYKARITSIENRLKHHSDKCTKLLEKSQKWAELANSWQIRTEQEHKKLNCLLERVERVKKKFGK